MAECVFCEIVAGRAHGEIVDEDPLSLALLDINPFAEGHCLVISKRHVPWWHDLDEAETVSLFTMAKRVANRLCVVFEPDFVCLYARGRRIPHTHLFLVPTSRADVLDRTFNELEKIQETSPELAPLRNAEALRSAAAKIQTRD